MRKLVKINPSHSALNYTGRPLGLRGIKVVSVCKLQEASLD